MHSPEVVVWIVIPVVEVRWNCNKIHRRMRSSIGTGAFHNSLAHACPALEAGGFAATLERQESEKINLFLLKIDSEAF